MSLLLNFAAAIALQVGIGAPADVPKDHWAYGAVDELFRVGVLHGYPSNARPLRLDPTARKDSAAIDRLIIGWINAGVLPEYIPGNPRMAWNDSDYARAVAVHYAYTLILENPDAKSERAQAREQIPSIVRAVSMLRPELVRLGGEPETMLADLNRIWLSGGNRSFNGR